MDTTTLIAVITALVGGLFGKEAWSYYKKRLDVKVKQKNASTNEENKLRDELKDLMETRINDCKKQLEDTIAKVQVLQSEKAEIQERLSQQDVKIALLTERLGNYSFKSRGKRKNISEE